MSVQSVTEQNFEQEVLQSDVPVLVDFWASWCGPCRMMLPVVDELAEDIGQRARVVKVNVDEAGSLAARYRVQSIPTFAVFEGGELRDQQVGVVSKDRLLNALQPHLN